MENTIEYFKEICKSSTPTISDIIQAVSSNVGSDVIELLIKKHKEVQIKLNGRDNFWFNQTTSILIFHADHLTEENYSKSSFSYLFDRKNTIKIYKTSKQNYVLETISYSREATHSYWQIYEEDAQKIITEFKDNSIDLRLNGEEI
ncbi:MAG: hypothetical protein PHX80_04380 [Candidatus Nanoarchaeia archaeon]|nr:hypothetical protein [Candidatus Nanoarchaeia archaeon]MDD5551252.1 hypothetical protein [Candidatus Omnitrophota bacterium]